MTLLLLQLPAQFAFVLCPPVAEHPCLPRPHCPRGSAAPPSLLHCHLSPAGARREVHRRLPPDNPWDIADLLCTARPDLVRLNLPKSFLADLRTPAGLKAAGLSRKDALSLTPDSLAARTASAQRIPGIALPTPVTGVGAREPSLAWFSATRPLPCIEQRLPFSAWF